MCLYKFTFTSLVYDGSFFPTSLPTIVVICVGDGSHFNSSNYLTAVRWNLNVVLICIFFMAKAVEHVFMCFLDILTYLFEEVLFSSLAHLFSRLLILWKFIIVSSLYIMVKSLVRCITGKDFLPFCGLPLQSGDHFFCCAESFSFM
jgi:hypothetical protein